MVDAPRMKMILYYVLSKLDGEYGKCGLTINLENPTCIGSSNSLNFQLKPGTIKGVEFYKKLDATITVKLKSAAELHKVNVPTGS